MKFAAAVLVLAISISGTATAQAPSLAVGTRVRITAPDHDLRKHVATVVEVRGDTLSLAAEKGVRAVPFSSITDLQVSTGTRNQFLRDAGIGLGAGFVLGAILGAASYEEPSLFTDSATEEAFLAGTMLGVVGMVAGGVVGAFHRADRWEDRPLRVRASIRPSKSGGVALSLSRAF